LPETLYSIISVVCINFNKGFPRPKKS
jgi:hypothetical protein